jgi:hypothetical protein
VLVVVVVAMAMASSLRYTSPLAQIAILGLVCFCFPGMFNAINGLGAAGKSDPTITDNANTALAVTFAVCSLLAGAIFNVLGHRAMLILGGFTYILYIGSYLSYNAVFVITAGALLGTALLSDVIPPLCACARVCFIFFLWANHIRGRKHQHLELELWNACARASGRIFWVRYNCK